MRSRTAALRSSSSFEAQAVLCGWADATGGTEDITHGCSPWSRQHQPMGTALCVWALRMLPKCPFPRDVGEHHGRSGWHHWGRAELTPLVAPAVLGSLFPSLASVPGGQCPPAGLWAAWGALLTCAMSSSSCSRWILARLYCSSSTSAK